MTALAIIGIWISASLLTVIVWCAVRGWANRRRIEREKAEMLKRLRGDM